MSVWNKWKYRLVLAICVWVLLATVFTIERYGSSFFLQETRIALWNKAGDFILLRWLNSAIITGLLAIVAALIGAYALWSVTIYTRHNSQRDALLIVSATAHSVAEAIIKNDDELKDIQLRNLEDQCAALSSLDSNFGLNVYKTALEITRWSKLGPANSLVPDSARNAKAISILCQHFAEKERLADGLTKLINPIELRNFAKCKTVFTYKSHLSKYFDWDIEFHPPSTPLAA